MTDRSELPYSIIEPDDETIREWLLPENISAIEKRSFEGFEITNSIDGGLDPNTEVSLVSLNRTGLYPQHVHKKSDAFFIVTYGSAIFLSGEEKRIVTIGERVKIPKGTPHGFEIKEGETFEFISIQSPPIKDRNSGEEDFHLLTDMI